MIAAMSRNRVIGKDNKLPWSVPEDWQYFLETIRGHKVLMGRKTFDSLEHEMLLPSFENIVISRNTQTRVHGAAVFGSLEDGLAHLTSHMKSGDEEVFVIGGEQIYRQALPFAHRIYLTVIEQDFAGDAYFPEFSLDEFKLESRKDRDNGYRYSFLIYDRVKPAAKK